MQEAIDKLDDQVVEIAEQTVLKAPETCDADHNNVLIKGALRSVLTGLSVSILDDSLGIRESFEDSIIQVSTAPKSPSVVVKAIVNDVAVMAPIPRFAAQIVKQTKKVSVINLVHTPPSTLPSGSDSSPDEARKCRKDRKPKWKSSRRKSPGWSSDKGTWSLKGSLKIAKKLAESLMSNSEDEDRAFQLKVLHATDSHFKPWCIIKHIFFSISYRLTMERWLLVWASILKEWRQL